MLLLSVVIFLLSLGLPCGWSCLFLFIYSLFHVSHATAVVSFLSELSLAGCVSE